MSAIIPRADKCCSVQSFPLRQLDVNTTVSTRYTASTSMYSLTQGRSQDSISTEAKGCTPAGSRGWAPGQGLGGETLLNPPPPETESFSIVECPNEMESLLQFSYFTSYSLFSKNVVSCI